MNTQMKARLTLALLSSVVIGYQTNAQAQNIANPYNDSSTQSTTTTTTTVNDPPVEEPLTPAVAETRGQTPTVAPSNIRVIPVVGGASFTTSNEATLENFDDGFAGGVYADFGRGSLSFETGILVMSTEGSIADLEPAFDVDSWSIPLLLKWSMTGRPEESVFLKAGVTPFMPDGTGSDFNVMGTVGFGGAIPLMQQTALTLEGTYNKILDNGTSLGEYQGFTAMLGLQLAL